MVAVRATARFCHNPKKVHYKAGYKILEYLNTTADLGLTFKSDGELGSVELAYGFGTHFVCRRRLRP